PRDRVVVQLVREADVLWVILPRAGGGNSAAARSSPQVFDRLAAAVPHRGPQTADKLEDILGQGAAVRHQPLHAFGDELEPSDLGRAARARGRPLVAVAVRAAGVHRALRAHAAVGLVPAARADDQFAG